MVNVQLSASFTLNETRNPLVMFTFTHYRTEKGSWKLLVFITSECHFVLKLGYLLWRLPIDKTVNVVLTVPMNLRLNCTFRSFQFEFLFPERISVVVFGWYYLVFFFSTFLKFCFFLNFPEILFLSNLFVGQHNDCDYFLKFRYSATQKQMLVQFLNFKFVDSSIMM